MVCPHENVIFADGHKVCTDCGLMFEHIVQYVTSYSNPSTYRRQPVYSRQKRFFHFLFKLGNKTVLKNHMRIMDVFGDIEFHYNICPLKSGSSDSSFRAFNSFELLHVSWKRLYRAVSGIEHHVFERPATRISKPLASARPTFVRGKRVAHTTWEATWKQIRNRIHDKLEDWK